MVISSVCPLGLGSTSGMMADLSMKVYNSGVLGIIGVKLMLTGLRLDICQIVGCLYFWDVRISCVVSTWLYCLYHAVLK